jgi:hypothetical protein
VSYLSVHRQDWRADPRLGLLFASVAGAASTIFCAAGLFGMAEYLSFADNLNYSLGYRIGMSLTLSIEVLAVLVPAAAVCALGLAVFGVPVTYWLGERAGRLWVAVLGLGWGVGAGGMTGVILFKWMFGGEAEWQVFFLLGAAFGAPTGFWWWFFYRRVLIRRSALAD